jgi:tetratricopeptide (TPR) repeat protein
MSSSAATCVKRAVELFLARDPVGSTDMFRQALKLDPGNVDATYGLGLLCLSSGKMDLAEGFFAAVLVRQPDLANAAYHLGLIASTRHDVSAARSWYRRALEQNPSHRRAAELLAKLERSDVR